jgi:hypothetical protein
MVGVKVLMEWRGAQPGCEALLQRTDGVNNANGPREEREGHRKTIAWGMPDVSGASAVNTGVQTSTTPLRTPGCGCIEHPASPAPSV